METVPPHHSECLLWDGPTRLDGYGRVTVGHQKRAYAHRVSYCDAHKLSLSEIDDFVVRHKCDNPRCVNPAHLELGTHADNVGDAVIRGRNARGEGHGSAKLSLEQVADIRSRKTDKRGQIVAIAKEFAVSSSLISLIRSNKLWVGQDT